MNVIDDGRSPADSLSDAHPALADLEFPAERRPVPSAEGKLAAALLSGQIDPDRYRRGMRVLAAREERAHPEFRLPPIGVEPHTHVAGRG